MVVMVAQEEIWAIMVQVVAEEAALTHATTISPALVVVQVVEQVQMARQMARQVLLFQEIQEKLIRGKLWQ